MTGKDAGDRGIFAIDRRAWAKACSLGLNAAVAYLFLARGTGGDNRTASWSVNAIEKRTLISRDRARKAIEALITAGLVRQDQGGRRPRYYLVPAHEVPGCEGNLPQLNPDERIVWDHLNVARKEVWLSNKKLVKWNYKDPRLLAARLVAKSYAREVSPHHFVAITPNLDEIAKPNWIWLPNTIIDGAAQETPPVELLWQTGEVNALRFFVDLYHAHRLAEDGGIHWRRIRQDYMQHEVGEHRQFKIWGFEPDQMRMWQDDPIISHFMTQEYDPFLKGEEDEEEDSGVSEFWTICHLLLELGLVDLVGHVITADTNEGEILHPYALPGTGEPIEQELARSAHVAARAMLPPAKVESISPRLWLLPLPNHMKNATIVGIPRLRYRPNTQPTGLWYARQADWAEWVQQYRDLEATSLSVVNGLQYQGAVKV